MGSLTSAEMRWRTPCQAVESTIAASESSKENCRFIVEQIKVCWGAFS